MDRINTRFLPDGIGAFDFTVTGTQILVTLADGFTMEIVDEALANNDGRDDYALHDLFGGAGDGWEWVPAEVAGLTSNPFIYSDCYEVPDHSDPYVGRIFYFEPYMLRSPLDDLRENGGFYLDHIQVPYVHANCVTAADVVAQTYEEGTLCDRQNPWDRTSDDDREVDCPECLSLMEVAPGAHLTLRK